MILIKIGFSFTANGVLEDKIKLLNLPAHKLIIDVSTRSNSASDMIERFLELQPAIFAALTSKELRGKDKDLNTLSDEDFQLAEDVLACLKPMKTITTAICTEKQPTASIILPMLYELINKLMTPQENDTKCIIDMKKAICDNFETRYKDSSVHEFLKKTSVLDPRFKTAPFLSEEEKLLIFTQLTAVASAYVATCNMENLDSKVDEETAITTTSDVTPSKLKKYDSGCGIFTLLNESYSNFQSPPSSSPSPIDLASAEITKFRDETPISLTASPLQWWKENDHKYPALSHLAKIYLSVPATSVPSERVFSTAGDIVSCQRSCLKPSNVDKLIFLKKNI